jgi:hypothetical protein
MKREFSEESGKTKEEQGSAKRSCVTRDGVNVEREEGVGNAIGAAGTGQECYSWTTLC